jgi:nucleotide-binding universal stress UspA family protein
MISSMTEESAGAPQGAPADDRLKFLIVAHDCPEARLAAYFTARRARRGDARVVLLHVIEPPEYGHWATVAETMRAEARERAEATVAEFAAIVEAETGERPQSVIREGILVDELRGVIDEDPLISILVLGASADPKGPGPLVSALAHRPAYLGQRPIPVTVVPGTVTREDLRKIS